MRLFSPDADYLVGRHAALTTAAEVCLVVDSARPIHAGAIFSACGYVPMLNAIILLH